MAILVKRFRVRYNGVSYGPGQPGGQVIEGLSKEEEARLVEASNGNIERYIYPQAPEGELPGDDDNDGKGEENTGSGADDRKDGDEGSETAEPEGELLNIDPADLIRPQKGKRR